MKTNSENSLELLKEVLPILETTDDYSNDNLFGILSAFGKEHEPFVRGEFYAARAGANRGYPAVGGAENYERNGQSTRGHSANPHRRRKGQKHTP